MNPRRLVALSALGLSALAALPAHAGLLDEPPKLCTFKLEDPTNPKLPLLRAFMDVETERPGPTKNYLAGPWGKWKAQPWWNLAWQTAEQPFLDADVPRDALSPADPIAFDDRGTEHLLFAPDSPTWLSKLNPSFASPVVAWAGVTLSSNGFDALWEAPKKPVPNWRCRRRPVRFVRYGAEQDNFPLVFCDGSVAPQALDRMTLIARPPEVPRPGELLSDEPDADAWREHHEWSPGVRLVNPRLIWALQKISDGFPWRTVYVFSGYRPPYASHDGHASEIDPGTKEKRAGSHHSMHAEARALDISVMGIPNEALFKYCRTLEDVGCGFYPNSKFVHVDVRKPGTGHAFWIDDSAPGEPSHYVDSWAGVVEKGALTWDPKRP